MFKGYQELTDEQRVKAARLAALAGHDFFNASHVWYMDGEMPALALKLKTGVNVLIHT
jgi:hypothetical protein